MRVHSTFAALTLAGAVAVTAAPAAQADTVLRFGDRDFGVTIRIEEDPHYRGGRHIDDFGRPQDRGYNDPGYRSHVAPAQNRRSNIWTPRRVRQSLRGEGFRRMSRPDYRPNRNVYVVDGVDRRGRDVRIRVDASTGNILAVRPRGAQNNQRVNRGGHQGGRQNQQQHVRVLSPDEARVVARQHGFYQVGPAQYRGANNVYVMNAMGENGVQLLVSVNARSGSVTGVQRR